MSAPSWQELFYRQRAIEDLSNAARNLEQRDIDKHAEALLLAKPDLKAAAAMITVEAKQRQLLAEVYTWALAAGMSDDALLAKIKATMGGRP